MKNTGKLIIIALLLAFSALLFSGCLNLATSSAQAVYNQHSIKKSLTDQWITLEIYQALANEKSYKNANISVSTYNGEVLLAGEVPYAWQKAKVEQIARKIAGVSDVYNMIKIASPSSSLTRISDSWITTKVKAKLIASDDLDATQIKVVTENGTVFLMGMLKPEEAQVAVDLARQTDGVESVVKVFSYVHITKSTPEFANNCGDGGCIG